MKLSGLNILTIVLVLAAIIVGYMAWQKRQTTAIVTGAEQADYKLTLHEYSHRLFYNVPGWQNLDRIADSAIQDVWVEIVQQTKPSLQLSGFDLSEVTDDDIAQKAYAWFKGADIKASGELFRNVNKRWIINALVRYIMNPEVPEREEMVTKGAWLDDEIESTYNSKKQGCSSGTNFVAGYARDPYYNRATGEVFEGVDMCAPADFNTAPDGSQGTDKTYYDDQLGQFQYVMPGIIGNNQFEINNWLRNNGGGNGA